MEVDIPCDGSGAASAMCTGAAGGSQAHLLKRCASVPNIDGLLGAANSFTESTAAAANSPEAAVCTDRLEIEHLMYFIICKYMYYYGLRNL